MYFSFSFYNDTFVCVCVFFFLKAAVPAGNQLVSQESSTKGAISWRTYRTYSQALGGLLFTHGMLGLCMKLNCIFSF